MDTSDWRKYAATTYPDQDVEKAFLDQAYVFIQNKATPLMRDPYRLGFEIVFKNDDNTRMVGIFVFRVDDDLLYAPVFFINGEVKGTDLLYRHNTKKFVPLNNDWCQYLISLSNYAEGSKIEKDMSGANKGMNVQELVTPPAYKSASVKEAWEDMQKEAGEGPEKGSLLKQFIMEDGGYSAVQLLTDTATENTKYASYLVDHVGMENVMPDELNEATRNKPAPVKEELIYEKGFFGEKYASKGGKITDTRKNLVCKVITNESEKEHKADSYGGKHVRWEHGVYEIIHKDGTSGKYKIAAIEDSKDVLVLADDGWQQVPADSLSIVGHEKDAASEDGAGLSWEEKHQASLEKNIIPKLLQMLETYGSARVGQGTARPEDLERLLGEKYKVSERSDGSGSNISLSDIEEMRNHPFQAYTRDLKELPPADILNQWAHLNDEQYHPKGNPLTRSHDDLISDEEVDVGDELIAKILEWKQSQEGGGIEDSASEKAASFPMFEEYEKTAHLKEGSWYTQVLSTDENLKVTEPFQVVKEMDTLSDGVERYKVKGASGHADWLNFRDDEEKYFLQLPQGNDEFKLMDTSNFDQLAKGANLSKASVFPRGHYFVVNSVKGISSEMPKLASQIYLMAELGMNEETSENIMEKAASGKFTFYYEPLEKHATNLSFEQPPEFYTGFDPDFGMPSEEPQKMTVISDSDEPQDPAQRIGDGMKFDNGKQLEGHNADSLAQLSMDTGQSSLFEHGAVGNLVDTYDSTMLIDKYIPNMEEGLDKIGRLLFLFYWKPNDFSRLYGSDDQSGLENKLVSNFKSFGDLVLELLKKTKFNSAGIALSANN